MCAWFCCTLCCNIWMPVMQYWRIWVRWSQVKFNRNNLWRSANPAHHTRSYEVTTLYATHIERCILSIEINSAINVFTIMTSSYRNIFHVTGPLCGEFTGHGESTAQRPVTRSFDVFFDLGLNKQLSQKSWGWWFETPSRSLWRHSNDDKNNWSHLRMWQDGM